MGRKYIKCECCGNLIYEGETCFEHEYGRKFCSYKCLVIEGFYGHYKAFELEESRLDNEEFITMND